MDILQGLNPAQREAVQVKGGPLLILAGPGSGKTRVITHRIAYLVQACQVSPRRVLGVTFTNKAAREMRGRLAQLLGGAVEILTLGTFHALGARILRADGHHIGVDKGFVIYDDDDQLALLKRCLQDLSLDPKRYPPKAIQGRISAAKADLSALHPQDFSGQVASYFEEVVARVYERYQARLQEASAQDFDDLILSPIHLFRSHPQVLARYQERYLHLLIDEFQDTNLAQYELAKLLAAQHRNLCVVGDPDQSIYSWRFADLRNILSFEKDYPEAQVVYLGQNYRSTRTILEAASQVISANVERKPTRLWTQNPAGLPITVTEAYDEVEEARWVVAEVERLAREERRSYSDFAVMYRTNAQSRPLEEAFLRYGVPYRLVGATRFYQRREVKDALAYLRLLHNTSDSLSLARIINVPGRGIGQRTIAELTVWAQGRGLSLYAALQATEESPFSPRTLRALADFLQLMEGLKAQAAQLDVAFLLDMVLVKTGYKDYILAMEDGEERWENLLELRTVASDYGDYPPGEGLAAFLEGVALVSDVDNLDQQAAAVTLITLHQAKGLEFPAVFIVGVEEGLLPHIRSFDDLSQMEEERRLFYVGMTRAKERLSLVRAFRRAFLGRSAPNPPSRFLADLPPHLVASPTRAAAPIPQGPSPLPDLRLGERVRHATFGDGVVVAVFPSGGDREVTVAFPSGARRLLQSLAKLEKL